MVWLLGAGAVLLVGVVVLLAVVKDRAEQRNLRRGVTTEHMLRDSHDSGSAV